MKYILKNANVYENGKFIKKDILVGAEKDTDKCVEINAEGLTALPGFVDVHVHFRQPGFEYKETISSGSSAAAAGGYTDVCTMPNLKPVPDCVENIKMQTDAIKENAIIGVHPYAAITKGEAGEYLSDMDELAKIAIAFSDDGRGVQNEEIMKCAMEKAKILDKIIAAHCEDNSLLNGGYIHDGKYAKQHNHRGISSESEYAQIKRDIELAKKTGVKYHVCHISTAQSVALIRKAKADGIDITCETAPHYLVLTDSDLQEDGRFKMNPPLRDEKDRQALVEGIADGTIDMIATDHAPHSAEEKSKGLEKSLMGVVGLETAFPIMYTYLVKNNIISMQRLMELMHYNPINRFKINTSYDSENFTLYDLNKKYRINPNDFQTMGRSTPFENVEVFGKCMMTFYKGEPVWQQILM